jgi:hypothetical protein
MSSNTAEIKKMLLDEVIKLAVWNDYFPNTDTTLSIEFADDEENITLEKINATKYLLEYQAVIQKNILQALLPKYQFWKEQYQNTVKDIAKLMPIIKTPLTDFRKFIYPTTIHVIPVNKNQLAYIGYEFSCLWDEEHGLGFMTHADTIIQVGSAEVSFLTWIAQRDMK